jgi:hypothetical protein
MQQSLETIYVTHIVSLYEDKILVCFADNSLAIFSLPSLTLTSRLESSWLNPVCGDVTSIHVDENHLRNFAYIGTAEGFVRVLQVVPDFREVDYVITMADSAVTGRCAVSDLQISPKVLTHIFYRPPPPPFDPLNPSR